MEYEIKGLACNVGPNLVQNEFGDIYRLSVSNTVEEPFRTATEQEREYTLRYLRGISKHTGRDFYDRAESKWIDSNISHKCYCSNCNVRLADSIGISLEDADAVKIQPTCFCPNCGAKMTE